MAGAGAVGLASNELISLTQTILSGSFRLAITLQKHFSDKNKITIINGDRIFSDSDLSKISISFHKSDSNKESHYVEIVFDPKDLDKYYSFFDAENAKVTEKNDHIKQSNAEIDRQICLTNMAIERYLSEPNSLKNLGPLFNEKARLEGKRKEPERMRFFPTEVQNIAVQLPSNQQQNQEGAPICQVPPNPLPAPVSKKYSSFHVSKFMAQRFVENEELEYLVEACIGKALGSHFFKSDDFKSTIDRLANDLVLRGMTLTTAYADNKVTISITDINLNSSITSALFKILELPESNLTMSLGELFETVTHETANSIIAYRNERKNEDIKLQIERLSLEAEKMRLMSLLRPTPI